MAEAFIVAASRTAGGRRGGKMKDWHPVSMASQILNDLVRKVDADPAMVEDVIMGCVTQAGEQSVNVARNAVLAAGFPESVPATSVDRQCGSSQQALHFAAQAVMSGSQNIAIAAGVESMSRVPMGLAAALPAQNGFGSPNPQEVADRYDGFQFSQFVGAEMVAKKYNLERETLDAFALSSHQKAIAAAQAGLYDAEILALEVTNDDGTTEMHKIDEGIRYDATMESISGVKLLAEDGRLTAASASQICDGASGVLVVNEQGLKDLGVEPLARIHHLTVTGGDPVIMLEAPIPATKRALEKSGMSINDIDLYEVNEAFASVPAAWLQEIGADPERLNVHGGAIALGHPLGASGTKLMTTLLNALNVRGKKYGLQTMCEGGGLANVTIVENLQ
jgi:acetyl-CoA C-acetyltransferase